MKTADIKGLSKDELKRQMNETQEELFQTRLQNISGSLENTAKIRELRRNVARMKTIAKQTTSEKTVAKTGKR